MDAEVIRLQSELEDGHWWFKARAEIVRELIPKGGPDRAILDVGCGWGGLTKNLLDLGKVLGVEPSDVAREEAVRRGVPVVEGTAERLPVDDGAMDVVVASDVVEHLDDDVAALREMRRVLRPGGVAVITVPAYQWLFSSHDVALSHRRRYTRGTLVKAARAAGLEPVRTTYFNTILFPPVAVVRLLTRNRPAAVDAKPTWGPANAVLYRIFSSERHLVNRRSLPFGLSLALIARPA